MAANYLPYDSEQMLLLPEALQDWLPEGHLAHFISDAVDELDLRPAEGAGQGAFLLMDALRRCFEHAANVAAMAVVVDAKDDEAAAFYRHFRFLALQKDPRRLYLPMKTVAQLVGA